MKTNLSESIRTLIAEMHESGEFDEAVLNAIENFGSRVVNLETTQNNQKAKINNLETRLISVESRYLSSEYDIENKKLILTLSNEGSDM